MAASFVLGAVGAGAAASLAYVDLARFLPLCAASAGAALLFLVLGLMLRKKIHT